MRKQGFGHRFVVATRGEAAAEVAAAKVDRQQHVRGFVRNHTVDERGIAPRQFVGIVSTRAGRGAQLRIAQVSEVGVVELHVVAARCGQTLKFFSIGACHVLVKGRIELRVGRQADALAAAAEVQHGRRGNRHLRAAVAAQATLHEAEVLQLDVLLVPHLVDDANEGRDQLFAAIGLADGMRLPRFHAVELVEKVDVEAAAAVFPVADALESKFLLEVHQLADGLVLDCA